jgi:hypothetical protein
MNSSLDLTRSQPSKPISKLSLLALALAFTVASSAVADEVVLPANQDATLYQDQAGEAANGAGSHVFVGWGDAPKRALLRFDVGAAIPPGSTVQSVEMTLYMSRTITQAVRDRLYRVTTPWSEGPTDPIGQEGQGDDSQTGDATWIHTSYDAAFWTMAGGGSTPEMVADVQTWVDDPASNNGWILIGPENFFQSAKRFDSRENVNPDRRPALRVVFAPPPVVEIPTLATTALATLALLLALAGWRVLRRS